MFVGGSTAADLARMRAKKKQKEKRPKRRRKERASRFSKVNDNTLYFEMLCLEIQVCMPPVQVSCNLQLDLIREDNSCRPYNGVTKQVDGEEISWRPTSLCNPTIAQTLFTNKIYLYKLTNFCKPIAQNNNLPNYELEVLKRPTTSTPLKVHVAYQICHINASSPN
ncbi:hypothetical protein YC2023_058984 [Brassica napus]